MNSKTFPPSTGKSSANYRANILCCVIVTNFPFRLPLRFAKLSRRALWRSTLLILSPPSLAWHQGNLHACIRYTVFTCPPISYSILLTNVHLSGHYHAARGRLTSYRGRDTAPSTTSCNDFLRLQFSTAAEKSCWWRNICTLYFFFIYRSHIRGLLQRLHAYSATVLRIILHHGPRARVVAD